MHYLMPKHEVLSSLERQEVLEAYSLKIEEVPALMYEDAALRLLRLQGLETPIDSLVRIIVTRPRFSEEDSANPAERTKTKFRVIKGV